MNDEEGSRIATREMPGKHDGGCKRAAMELIEGSNVQSMSG